MLEFLARSFSVIMTYLCTNILLLSMLQQAVLCFIDSIHHFTSWSFLCLGSYFSSIIFWNSSTVVFDAKNAGIFSWKQWPKKSAWVCINALYILIPWHKFSVYEIKITNCAKLIIEQSLPQVAYSQIQVQCHSWTHKASKDRRTLSLGTPGYTNQLSVQFAGSLKSIKGFINLRLFWPCKYARACN